MAPTRMKRYLIVVGRDRPPSVNVEWVGPKCTLGEPHAGVWDTYAQVDHAKRIMSYYAMRCPASLTRQELDRVRDDDPPGSWQAQLERVRKEYGAKARKRAKREQIEKDEVRR